MLRQTSQTPEPTKAQSFQTDPKRAEQKKAVPKKPEPGRSEPGRSESAMPEPRRNQAGKAMRGRSEPGKAQRRSPELPPIIGRSPSMLSVLERTRILARLRRPVLITGPSGSGKEGFARLLHQESGLTGDFVVLNCAALPEHIAEAELFGYERGAYTGARDGYPGMVGQAEGGTLFLDEVAELAYPLQLKLLRFLQDGSYRRLGTPYEQQANVRIVAATNRSLENLVTQGLFRQDLFYRLGVLRLVLPPLHERGEDVVLIARHFLATDPDCSGLNLDLSPSACKVLEAYPWPGNVRELQSTLLEAALLSSSGLIGQAHLEAVLSFKLPGERLEESLLDLVPHGMGISGGELRSRSRMSNGTLHRRLEALLKEGKLRRVGRGNQVRYERPEDRPLPAQGQAQVSELKDPEKLQQVQRLLDEQGPLSRRQLAGLLQVSERTMNRLLLSWTRQEVVIPSGRGRSVVYSKGGGGGKV